MTTQSGWPATLKLVLMALVLVSAIHTTGQTWLAFPSAAALVCAVAFPLRGWRVKIVTAEVVSRLRYLAGVPVLLAFLLFSAVLVDSGNEVLMAAGTVLFMTGLLAAAAAAVLLGYLGARWAIWPRICVTFGAASGAFLLTIATIVPTRTTVDGRPGSR